VESYLRNGLALGADKAVRIWEDGFDDLSPYQKAVLISGAVTVFGADLVLTGAKSADTGSGIVGQMAAARLSLPCVSDAVRVEVDQGQKSVTAVKDMGRGEREKVSCPLPAVITVKGDGKLPYASLDSLIESKSREIPALSRAELGVSEIEFKNSPTAITALTYPRPRPRKAPPLDTGLPAFYRILQLLEGGITKRKGLKLEGNSEELAERLFELLKEEGIIRPGA
jgi:electron transfer flavoprotein beta subunit